MAEELERMRIDERRMYLKRMQPRYQRADRAERGRLLSEMEAVTGLHRKSLVRLLRGPSLERRPRQRQRGRRYGPAVERVVVQVWEALDFICAERLTPTLLQTARHLRRWGCCPLTRALEAQLAQISEASVTRLLAKHRGERLRLPRRGLESANRLTKEVPMGRIPWETREPGHCEVDLVHHAGTSAAGEYAHTLQMVDVATGWSERVALLGRGQAAMEQAFRTLLARLPFQLVELHPDNGSEFFNAHLKRFYGALVPRPQLSRSRPYHKNDNRFVEQKNDSLVRRYVGYGRLETPEQLAALNAFYATLSPYVNLFQPVLHLAEKTPVPDASGQLTRLRRRWDTAQTPFQRLLASGGCTRDHQRRLHALYDRSNPVVLRRSLYHQLASLWDGADPPTTVPMPPTLPHTPQWKGASAPLWSHSQLRERGLV